MGQDEEGFEMSGYTEIALLQYELALQRAELAKKSAEIERLKTVPMMYRRMAFNAQLQDENNELRQQLAAAQEENGQLENQVLARDAELWGRTQEILGLKDQLAKAEQLWQVAQGRCDGLEEKLAKAEQRVSEACALACEDVIGNTANDQRMIAAIDCSAMIHAGEWRKFVKEV